jgi:threonine dehydrogenase-like Zn-dependent dehydrogenase
MTAVARGMEASRIVVIDRNADRLEMARAFGADDVINAGEVPEARDRIRLVKAQTDGGADVVAELVGSPQVVPEGIAMLANWGYLPRDRKYQHRADLPGGSRPARADQQEHRRSHPV